MHLKHGAPDDIMRLGHWEGGAGGRLVERLRQSPCACMGWEGWHLGRNTCMKAVNYAWWGVLIALLGCRRETEASPCVMCCL
jgi:hypothetical protein